MHISCISWLEVHLCLLVCFGLQDGQSFWTVLLLGLLACVLSNKHTFILVQLFLEICVFHLVMGLEVCLLAGGIS